MLAHKLADHFIRDAEFPEALDHVALEYEFATFNRCYNVIHWVCAIAILRRAIERHALYADETLLPIDDMIADFLGVGSDRLQGIDNGESHVVADRSWISWLLVILGRIAGHEFLNSIPVRIALR